MKFTILKLTAFAMLATASGVFASNDSDEPSSQSLLRGSFLNDEDANLLGLRNLSTCYFDCRCPEGGCDMPQCRELCRCRGGGCNMPLCVHDCRCAGGGCHTPLYCRGDGCHKSPDQDEAEYDSGDLDHNEDEVLEETGAFAQA